MLPPPRALVRPSLQETLALLTGAWHASSPRAGSFFPKTFLETLSQFQMLNSFEGGRGGVRRAEEGGSQSVRLGLANKQEGPLVVSCV